MYSNGVVQYHERQLECIQKSAALFAYAALDELSLCLLYYASLSCLCARTSFPYEFSLCSRRRKTSFQRSHDTNGSGLIWERSFWHNLRIYLNQSTSTNRTFSNDQYLYSAWAETFSMSVQYCTTCYASQTLWSFFFFVATSNENGMDWIGCSMRSGTTHKIYVFDFIHHVDRCTNTIMRYDPHKIESNRTVSQRYTKLRHEITTLIDATSDRKIVTPWHAQADKDE